MPPPLTLPVYEYLSETEESVVYAAMVRLMPRRLAHPTQNDFSDTFQYHLRNVAVFAQAGLDRFLLSRE